MLEWLNGRTFFPRNFQNKSAMGTCFYAPIVTVVPGKLVFLSGILSRNSKGEIIGKGDMRAQVRQVYQNIEAALKAVGATWANVVKRQTFTTDMDSYFKNSVDVREEFCKDNLSASTTVEVRRLSFPDFLVEVDVIAVIDA